MITVRTVKHSEMETAKNFIRQVFPNAMVQITDDDTILIAEYDNRPIGFAHIVEESDRIILQGIGVDNSMRGQGIGTILLEHILDMFAEGDRPIYLKVKVMNPAIDLYSRYGFFLKKFGDSHVLVKKTNS
ncbi:Acetyltransferase (GNAT) family protein [Candidatus Bilamarchaeum dharawalense]|uniref:Acetyltransferase (GNAT) family protein n=1 Tax=Candidatus Bilamarchaeum dharawalense TaxID=2885759 RepID=A0A5E4LPS9_9ARCH|nr:Acetyltransferase (GNAT) family protein [Candidatus Bilamarchaeum dharawalense]